MKFNEISDSNILGRDPSFYNREADRYQAGNRKTAPQVNDRGEITIHPVSAPSKDPKYSTEPDQGKPSSPGFRGLNYLRALAGLPHHRTVVKSRDLVGLPPDLSSPLR